MIVREDKSSRTVSIEITSGEKNFVTLVAKGVDARVVDFMADEFRRWVAVVLDDGVEAKVTELAKEDAAR
jgi:hypothetical protein